jgi:alpha-beta hydrolase superfamily lysophospholipase
VQELCSYDAVVVVPGIMGSVLLDADSGEELWSVGTIAAWLRGAALEKLRALHVDDDERDGKVGRIRAAGFMTRPWWLPGAGGAEPYTGLVEALRTRLAHPSALLEFAYDWRLSVEVNGRLLVDAVDAHLRRWREHPTHERARRRRGSHERARVVLVAHSMGGLLCRSMLAERGSRDIRTVVTLGTPFEGSHDLLPQYRGLLEGDDVRLLTPADVAALGGDAELATQSAARHRAVYEVPLPDHRAIVGVAQQTPVTMTVDAGRVTAYPWKYLRDDADALVLDAVTRRPTSVPADGDGRVYDYSASLLGAAPVALAQQHAHLPRSGVVADALTHLLTHPTDVLERRRNLGGPQPQPGRSLAGLGLSAADAVTTDRPFEALVTGAADSQGFRVWLERADGIGEETDLQGRSKAGDGAWHVPVVVDKPGLYRLLAGDGGEPVARLIYAAG